MAAYPDTYISRDSTAAPDARIETEFADDGTIKYSRLADDVQYQVTLLHEWITVNDYQALLSWIASNGYGPHTFTLRGSNYSGTLVNEPAVRQQRGNLLMVESRFLAVRV